MSLARRYSRLPAPGAMLKLVQASETALEESALDFYEKNNLTWRAQFTNPSLARLGIGTEFLPAKSKRQKSSTNGDTESENQQNGWSCLLNRCRI
ncbi:uncharacterized protein LOC108652496 [Drosophila navojoa]|uniref:uncharacterized protein LOC108652496 n=1 Tax=Drosophila navojoa TaxID=7232 RepID=UPI0008465328|nr:uncharacterized protein LOC108652496 [Drosophila navojoa]